MSGKVIAIANQKGGVGKTTTTMNLGYALKEPREKNQGDGSCGWQIGIPNDNLNKGDKNAKNS